MPRPIGHTFLVAWVFAADRMDTWVLRASIAIPLVCITGLVVWHLLAYLVGKLPKKPRTVRQSPEPPSSTQSPEFLARGRAPTTVTPAGDSPEQLQQACRDLEDSLAETYVELAESWLRNGRPRKAAAALKKILQICPDSHQAQLAHDRLQQIRDDLEDYHS